MTLIDTHCHINDEHAFPEPAEAIRRAVAAGVARLGVVGVDRASVERTLSLADEFSEVFAIVGLHPNYAKEYAPSDLEWIEQACRHRKVKALGEIGLDYHWEYAAHDIQEQAFLGQMELARQLDLPVVFHCREAYMDLLGLLESMPRHPSLFHCFSGSPEDASRAIDLDCYFGVDGPLTYRKNAAYRELVATLPRDRIVVETDSPYLSPEPLRSKPNEPANVALVNEKLAEIWGVSSEESARITTENAKRFFRL